MQRAAARGSAGSLGSWQGARKAQAGREPRGRLEARLWAARRIARGKKKSRGRPLGDARQRRRRNGFAAGGAGRCAAASERRAAASAIRARRRGCLSFRASTCSAHGTQCALCSAQHVRDSIVVSTSACHAEDPGSIPGRGVPPAHASSLFLSIGLRVRGARRYPRGHVGDTGCFGHRVSERARGTAELVCVAWLIDGARSWGCKAREISAPVSRARSTLPSLP